MTEKDSGEFFKVQRTFAQLSHRYSQIIFHQFRRFGIHPGQMPLLMLLDQNDGLNQSEICRKLRIKPSTAAVSLQRMEKNGLIYREAVPYDARLKRIVATEKAMQYQELIHQSLEETEDRLTSGISPQDLAVFFRVINQMIRNMS